MMTALLIVLVVLLGGTAWLLTHRREPPNLRSTREILDRRFARGEITEDEYRRGRDLLTP